MVKDKKCSNFFCIFADSNRGVAQLASALAWGARGRMFESFRPDFENQAVIHLFV